MLFNNRVGAKKMVVFFCFGAGLWTEPQWLGPYHKPAQKKKRRRTRPILSNMNEQATVPLSVY